MGEMNVSEGAYLSIDCMCEVSHAEVSLHKVQRLEQRSLCDHPADDTYYFPGNGSLASYF